MDSEREVRLRRHIEDFVRSRLVDLEQDISRLQREVNESFTRLLERTDVAAAVPEPDQLLQQLAEEFAVAEKPVPSPDIALLRDSVAELEGQRTQAEVLNTLVSRSSSFAPRVVLFVVKGGNALAWAARGLEEGVGNASIRGLSVSLQADTVLRGALNSQQTFYGAPPDQAENEIILGRLGNVEPGRLLAVPLRVRSKPAAILYADSGDSKEVFINVEAIELLVHTAALVVELVSLRTRIEGAQAAASVPVAARSGELAGAGQAPTSGELGRQPVSAPLTPPSVTPPAPEPSPAAPPLFQPAVEQAQTATVSQPAPPVADIAMPAVAPSAPHDEEEKLHNDARRFARLLVSEIKLYNEQKVAEGRMNNDLYGRLKEDIDRSRQMYEKRVSPAVAAKFDYFYDELVNTLAEGVAAKLGSDYPGPSARP